MEFQALKLHLYIYICRTMVKATKFNKYSIPSCKQKQQVDPWNNSSKPMKHETLFPPKC